MTPEAVAGIPEFWTALSLDASAVGSFGASAVGRLTSGATVVSADTEASGLIQQSYAEGGANFVIGARVRDLHSATVGDVGSTLWLFLGAVMLLLAIACTNVANLMLVRGTTRAGEVAVRTALGASRGRITRQLLTESVLIALAGGVVGALAAFAFVDAFKAWGPGGIPRLAEVAVDGRALGFALFVSVLTGVLFGVAPALRAAKSAPSGVLLDGGRTATSGGARRLRSALVVVEVAMALVLVLAAGLLVNSFVRMRAVDPGFEADGLVAMQLDLRAGYEDRATWTPFWDALLERLSAVPGIRSAALSTFTPFVDFALVQSYTPEGADIPPDESVFLASVPMSASWVQTLGLRVLQGRAFDGSERPDGEQVIVVNRALADEYWPGEQNLVGKRIKSGSLATEDEGWYTVIGVVSNARHRLASEAAPAIYHPYTQVPWRAMSVIARVDGEAGPVLTAMRNVVHDLDPALPIRRAAPVTSLVTESVVRPRFYSVLSATFGALALILAIVGIYGTAAYATALRAREIGIRIALGARKRSVLTMLTLDALRLAIIGVAIGIPLALASARILEGYLFNVSATDPATYIVTAIVVTLAAAAAAWIPARRAARLDPMTTLRSDA